MGRPLFSSKFTSQNREPHIRVQPEATPHPAYNTWLSNPFDPDSDEFFERDVVYEAFVDPNQPPVQPSEEATEEGVRPLTPITLGTASDVSSSISDTSSDSDSGRSTPVDMTDNRYTRLGLEVRRIERSRSNSRSPVYHAPRIIRESSENNVFRHSGTTMVFHSRLRVAADPNNEEGTSTNAEPSAPIPIITPRTPLSLPPVTVTDVPVLTASPLPLPAMPSTSPGQVVTSLATPTPIPTVTSQLYNWDNVQSRDIYGSPTGPLPNRGARMSVAHITPIASHVVV
ncbi:hypothetical protein QCA50_019404 [Cerrena zonata]|uniref:Uncharacterized protein n=1 Tax=Cerrena zonata TaxID=2478898 RepID=A0AAW0FAM3_9APHY